MWYCKNTKFTTMKRIFFETNRMLRALKNILLLVIPETIDVEVFSERIENLLRFVMGSWIIALTSFIIFTAGVETAYFYYFHYLQDMSKEAYFYYLKDHQNGVVVRIVVFTAILLLCQKRFLKTTEDVIKTRILLIATGFFCAPLLLTWDFLQLWDPSSAIALAFAVRITLSWEILSKWVNPFTASIRDFIHQKTAKTWHVRSS